MVIRNINTAAIAQKPHHCNECKGAVKSTCYNTHIFYCNECGNIFAPKHGCFRHPYRENYNLEVEARYKNWPKPRKRWTIRSSSEKDVQIVPAEPRKPFNTERKGHYKHKWYRQKPKKIDEGEDTPLNQKPQSDKKQVSMKFKTTI